VARLGDSEELDIGEWVLAVGNPLQLSSTVTAGIVSAKSRNIGIIRDADADSEGSYAIENFIQTDAAINPGNSGGALVNTRAEVVGINTAIASRTGYYQGYGFAIPINLAKKIMNDLIERGYVTRAWLGIGMRDVTEAVAERYKMDRPRGVLVETVMDRSPASRAGLEVLDIILEIDGDPVQKPNEIQNAVALKSPGERVTLTILRNRRERNIEVELGQRDTGRQSARQEEEPDMPVLGLDVEDLNDNYRSQLNLGQDVEGVLVVAVERYSAAFDANIRRGSLITRIEDDPIASVSDYRRAIRKYQEGQVVIFHLQFQQTEYHAFVKMPE
jgi:serine protease Do